MSWPDIDLSSFMKNIRIACIFTFHKVNKIFWEKIGVCMLLSHSSSSMHPCEKGMGMVRTYSWGLTAHSSRELHSLSKAGIEVTGLRLGIQEAKAVKTPGWEGLTAGKW